MGAPQHTPGPWGQFAPRDMKMTGDVIPIGVPVSGQQITPVAWVPSWNRIEADAREATANARLIAAAPDLLDGCNALLGLLQLLSHRDDISDEVREFLTKGHRIDEAEAAVAKATGGEA
jgi:hypothetical protein